MNHGQNGLVSGNQESLDFSGSGNSTAHRESENFPVEVAEDLPCTSELLGCLESVLLAMKRGEICFSYEGHIDLFFMPDMITFYPKQMREGTLGG